MLEGGLGIEFMPAWCVDGFSDSVHVESPIGCHVLLHNRQTVASSR